jgi:DNA-binding CsgD family transcriptional regulator
MTEAQDRVAAAARLEKRLKPEERLPIIIRRISEGKSRRQVADELGCDESTVRRDLRRLALPVEQQAAIQDGAAAEIYLNQALLKKTGVDRRARNKISRRRREDRKTGKHSDPLAQDMLQWLSTASLTDSNAILVLSDATSQSQTLHDGPPKTKIARFRSLVSPVKHDPSSDYRFISPGPNFIERCSRELVRVLVQVEPAQSVRMAALEKALNAVRARGHWTDVLGSQTVRDNMSKRRDIRGGKKS